MTKSNSLSSQNAQSSNNHSSNNHSQELKSRDCGSEARSTFGFSLKHALFSLALFVVLTIIALFVRDSFIRPFLGDVIVVIWLYYAVASLWRPSPLKLTLYVLAFSFCIEFSQYFQILKLLNIDSKVLNVVLGSTYDPMDLVAYTLGGICCLGIDFAVEHWTNHHNN